MQGKIVKINKMLNRKEISAVELINMYIEYAKKINSDINAYIATVYEKAVTCAQKIDDIITNGGELSILEGIPMSIKDCICTKDINTTCCSKMLSGYKPIFDAFAVEKLQNSNAIMLGKTNMDEFAMGSTCETSCYGPTKNPYNTDCVPGGSSGGAAASVASDIAVFGLGTDTGGSVRQPASFCGCVGLKPTYGAISRYGLIAYASSFDQIGVLAQRVEDTAIVFDAINLYDYRDATCSNIARTPASDNLKKDIGGLKIGVLTDLFKNLNSQTDICINDALKIYEDLGAEISDVQVSSLEFALPVYYILACAEASSNLSRYDGIRYGYRTENFENIEEMICKTRSEAFGDEVKRRIILGNYVLSSGYSDEYYKKAEKMRSVIMSDFIKLFDDFDIIIAPTTASSAFKLGEFENDPVSMYLTDQCTVIANICGLPAVSIPCGYDSNNMPVGMQIIGNRFSENVILNAAYAFENVQYKNIYRKPQVGGDCLGI